MHLSGERRGDLGRLGATHPGLHVERFDPHIGKAHRFQTLDRPGARRCLALGARKARADLGREVLDDAVRGIVAERLLLERGRIVRGKILGKQGEGKGEGGQGQQGAFRHGGMA